jgi:hypothetical protein
LSRHLVYEISTWLVSSNNERSLRVDSFCDANGSGRLNCFLVDGFFNKALAFQTFWVKWPQSPNVPGLGPKLQDGQLPVLISQF